MNALIVVSASSPYSAASQVEPSESKTTLTAQEIVAGLSRDMERIERALRKLMLLR